MRYKFVLKLSEEHKDVTLSGEADDIGLFKTLYYNIFTIGRPSDMEFELYENGKKIIIPGSKGEVWNGVH